MTHIESNPNLILQKQTVDIVESHEGALNQEILPQMQTWAESTLDDVITFISGLDHSEEIGEGITEVKEGEGFIAKMKGARKVISNGLNFIKNKAAGGRFDLKSWNSFCKLKKDLRNAKKFTYGQLSEKVQQHISLVAQSIKDPVQLKQLEDYKISIADNIKLFARRLEVGVDEEGVQAVGVGLKAEIKAQNKAMMKNNMLRGAGILAISSTVGFPWAVPFLFERAWKRLGDNYKKDVNFNANKIQQEAIEFTRQGFVHVFSNGDFKSIFTSLESGVKIDRESAGVLKKILFQANAIDGLDADIQEQIVRSLVVLRKAEKTPGQIVDEDTELSSTVDMARTAIANLQEGVEHIQDNTQKEIAQLMAKGGGTVEKQYSTGKIEVKAEFKEAFGQKFMGQRAFRIAQAGLAALGLGFVASKVSGLAGNELMKFDQNVLGGAGRSFVANSPVGSFVSHEGVAARVMSFKTPEGSEGFVTTGHLPQSEIDKLLDSGYQIGEQTEASMTFLKNGTKELTRELVPADLNEDFLGKHILGRDLVDFKNLPKDATFDGNTGLMRISVPKNQTYVEFEGRVFTPYDSGPIGKININGQDEIVYMGGKDPVTGEILLGTNKTDFPDNMQPWSPTVVADETPIIAQPTSEKMWFDNDRGGVQARGGLPKIAQFIEDSKNGSSGIDYSKIPGNDELEKMMYVRAVGLYQDSEGKAILGDQLFKLAQKQGDPDLFMKGFKPLGGIGMSELSESEALNYAKNAASVVKSNMTGDPTTDLVNLGLKSGNESQVGQQLASLDETLRTSRGLAANPDEHSVPTWTRSVYDADGKDTINATVNSGYNGPGDIDPTNKYQPFGTNIANPSVSETSRFASISSITSNNPDLGILTNIDPNLRPWIASLGPAAIAGFAAYGVGWLSPNYARRNWLMGLYNVDDRTNVPILENLKQVAGHLAAVGLPIGLALALAPAMLPIAAVGGLGGMIGGKAFVQHFLGRNREVVSRMNEIKDRFGRIDDQRIDPSVDNVTTALGKINDSDGGLHLATDIQRLAGEILGTNTYSENNNVIAQYYQEQTNDVAETEANLLIEVIGSGYILNSSQITEIETLLVAGGLFANIPDVLKQRFTARLEAQKARLIFDNTLGATTPTLPTATQITHLQAILASGGVFETANSAVPNTDTAQDYLRDSLIDYRYKLNTILSATQSIPANPTDADIVNIRDSLSATFDLINANWGVHITAVNAHSPLPAQNDNFVNLIKNTISTKVRELLSNVLIVGSTDPNKVVSPSTMTQITNVINTPNFEYDYGNNPSGISRNQTLAYDVVLGRYEITNILNQPIDTIAEITNTANSPNLQRVENLINLAISGTNPLINNLDLVLSIRGLTTDLIPKYNAYKNTLDSLRSYRSYKDPLNRYTPIEELEDITNAKNSIDAALLLTPGNTAVQNIKTEMDTQFATSVEAIFDGLIPSDPTHLINSDTRTFLLSTSGMTSNVDIYQNISQLKTMLPNLATADTQKKLAKIDVMATLAKVLQSGNPLDTAYVAPTITEIDSFIAELNTHLNKFATGGQLAAEFAKPKELVNDLIVELKVVKEVKTVTEASCNLNGTATVSLVDDLLLNPASINLGNVAMAKAALTSAQTRILALTGPMQTTPPLVPARDTFAKKYEAEIAQLINRIELVELEKVGAASMESIAVEAGGLGYTFNNSGTYQPITNFAQLADCLADATHLHPAISPMRLVELPNTGSGNWYLEDTDPIFEKYKEQLQKYVNKIKDISPVNIFSGGVNSPLTVAALPLQTPPDLFLQYYVDVIVHSQQLANFPSLNP